MAIPRESQLPPLTFDPRASARGLLAVSRLVVGTLERARRLSDDRPELALATLERWLDGDDGPAELHEAMELMVQATFADREVVAATRCVLWAMRVNVINPSRAADVARQVMSGAVEVLVALGEESEAALQRVDVAYYGALDEASSSVPSSSTM